MFLGDVLRRKSNVLRTFSRIIIKKTNDFRNFDFFAPSFQLVEIHNTRSKKKKKIASSAFVPKSSFKV